LELDQRAGKVGHQGRRKQLRSWFVLLRTCPPGYNILCSRTQRDTALGLIILVLARGLPDERLAAIMNILSAPRRINWTVLGLMILIGLVVLTYFLARIGVL
jgi:hypothetical protein